MNQILQIFLFAAGIFVCYLLISFIIFLFSRRELMQKGIIPAEDHTIQIYAEAEALEYYLLLALAASENRRMKIIVHIPKTDGACDDMISTVRMMRRKHKNIFYVLEK